MRPTWLAIWLRGVHVSAATFWELTIMTPVGASAPLDKLKFRANTLHSRRHYGLRVYAARAGVITLHRCPEARKCPLAGHYEK